MYQCRLDKFSIYDFDWKEFIDNEYVTSSILPLENKTSKILNSFSADETEQIIISTDDNVEVTSISAEKISDDTEGIIFTTDDDIPVTSIEISSNNKDDSEILEFKNELENETYVKIGVVDDKKGLFVNNLYDLNGNPIVLIDIDTETNILTLSGKKYKMIPYIEN